MFTKLVSRMHCTTMRQLLNERFKILIRQHSTSDVINQEGLIYKPEFTDDEQKYILQRLNNADVEQLGKFSLPKNRIKQIENWKKKNGRFSSLIDVLDVEGLGVKSLDKLCKNILQGETCLETADGTKKTSKGRGQYLTPLINSYQLKELSSALGIHLYATGISWARIARDENYLTDWNSFEFNLGTKKLSPADALQLVIDASNKIPVSDLYVFEAPISVTPTAQQSAISVSAYVQRIQFLSMLITYLSTSPKHNPDFIKLQQLKEEELDNENRTLSFSMDPKVFFLRHRLPARLFRTLIGTERVSAATTVANILKNDIREKLIHTPLNFDYDLHLMYDKQLPITKEVLGQALLLTMSFMDICVYQNANSLKAVSSNNR